MALEHEDKYHKLTKDELHFNSYKSNARGIVILKKDSWPAKDFFTSNILAGNLTKITFNFANKSYAIMALYGIQSDEVNFFPNCT